MHKRLVCLAIALVLCACNSVSVPWRGEDPSGDASSLILRSKLRSSWSQEDGETLPESGPEDGPESREESEEAEVEPLNALVLFLGATYKEEADASFALSYVRRLNPLLALGVTVEGTPSTREPVLLLPALVLYPIRRLYVLASPGLEFEHGDPLPLLRVGVGWDIELGGSWTVAPEVNYDFVKSSADAVVAGFAFAYNF